MHTWTDSEYRIENLLVIPNENVETVLYTYGIPTFKILNITETHSWNTC